MAQDGIPVVGDVTFRVSADGRMIGLDFECRDGAVRRLAAPAEALPLLMAGFLWAGADAAERGGRRGPLDPALRDHLRDGARAPTGWRALPDAHEHVLLELESGGAIVCVRLAKAEAEALAQALVDAARG